MPDQPYTFYEGWAPSGPMLRNRRPALIVLGDLDAARRRLAPPANDRALPSFRKVAGTCPACSGNTLMLGAGDHVTCSLIGCPDPMAARRRLAPLDDAAIERAARALYAYGSSLMAVDWDRATETTKMQHRLTAHVAIVALAAAEETPGG